MQEAYYKAFHAPPVNSEAQEVVTEPYLKSVLAAYNKAPFVSQWLDTVYGQNVGNALNTAVVNLLAGKGGPAGHRQRGQDRRQEGLRSTTMSSSDPRAYGSRKTACGSHDGRGRRGQSRRPRPGAGRAARASGGRPGWRSR